MVNKESYHVDFNIENADITRGINESIYLATGKAIEKNNKELFISFNEFVYRLLNECIDSNSVVHFKQYINFSAYCYDVASVKNKNSKVLDDIQKYYCIKAVDNLKSLIDINLSFYNRESNNLEEMKIINHFYYWSFYGYNTLLYNIVNHNDFPQFEYAIRQLYQLYKLDYTREYELKFKIDDLKELNQDDSKSEQIKKLEEEKDIITYPDMYRRHTIVSIKYWIIFLFRVNKLKIDKAISLIEQLKNPIVDSEDNIKDILLFTSSVSYGGYMGWLSWNCKESKSGESLSPSPSEWMLEGFFVEQIRENNFYINPNNISIEDLKGISSLYERVKSLTKYFEKDFEKWKKILKVESQEELKSRCERILLQFEIAKQLEVNPINTAIANLELSIQKIADFKTKIGNAWKREARIQLLFDKTGNTQLIQNQDESLKRFGRRTFFEKAKMMFIDGEYYQNIFGTDAMGAEIGRQEDNGFFEVALKGDFNKVSSSSLIEVIEQSLGVLHDKGKSATMILLSPEYSYEDEEFLKDSRYISKINIPQELPFFCIGEFDGIPIYTSFSDFLKNKVVVCNFENSFEMLYKANDNGFENKLTVEVREVTEADAIAKLTENPNKWKRLDSGQELSNEDALIVIRTSVIIDIWTILDFHVKDYNEYVVGYLQPLK